MTSDEPEQPTHEEKADKAPDEAADAKGTKANGPLVQVDIKATATDVLGLGAAARTPAGEAVARGVAGPLGHTLYSLADWLFGARNARTDADRQILDARARATVRVIDAETDERVRAITERRALAAPTPNEIVDAEGYETLRISAGHRLIAQEIRRQERIEATITEAVEIANTADGTEPPSEVSEEFAIKWVEGVKDASAENVRSIYARLLASQVTPNPARVSAPSLTLLESLDGNLVATLESFILKQQIFEQIPWFYTVEYLLDERSISLLIEIGFLELRKTSGYRIGGMSIMPNGIRKTILEYDYLALSVRGQEIVEAVYTEEYVHSLGAKNIITKEEVTKDTIRILDEMSFFDAENYSVFFHAGYQSWDLKLRRKGNAGFTKKDGDKLIDIETLEDLDINKVPISDHLRPVFEEVLKRFVVKLDYSIVDFNLPDFQVEREEGPESGGWTV